MSRTRTRGLPDGSRTESVDEYVKAWTGLVTPVCETLGWLAVWLISCPGGLLASRPADCSADKLTRSLRVDRWL